MKVHFLGIGGSGASYVSSYLKVIHSETDEVFTMLIGDEVPPRKRFIQTHAKQAILDI